jgi:hypothetical protein
MYICVKTQYISNTTFNKLIGDKLLSNLLIVVRVSTNERRAEYIDSKVGLYRVNVWRSLT